MKIVARTATWEHEPWTIISIEETNRTSYQAFNTRTGERKQMRVSYEDAWKDIPQRPQAEPWGV